MSILIRGMDMPENGTYAINLHVIDGKAYVRTLTKDGTGAYEAVEIPTPHGRLIDFDSAIDKYWDGNRMELTKWDLNDISTVIEAED